MRNMKVSMKLATGFLVVTVLAIIVGLVGIIGMMQINRGSRDIYYEQTRPLVEMGYSMEFFQRMRVQVRNIAIHSGNNARIENYVGLFQEREQQFIIHFEEFRQVLHTPEGMRLADEIYSDFRVYFQPGMQEIIAGARAGRSTDELMELMGATTEAADRISDNLSRIISIRVGLASTLAYRNIDLYALLLIIIIAALVISVAIAVVLAIYISGLISKPLVPLTAFFERAAHKGDLEFERSEMEVVSRYKNNKDEMGRLTSSALEFSKEINHEMDLLSKVADGDLSFRPNILSDRDVVGKALTNLIDNLNNMFSEIASASQQVSYGAQQIADGAQTLAQGSTEQSDTVQKLSESTGDIAVKTRDNAQMADKAAGLAATIKGNAEKGSRQMEEMMAAVKDINQASQNISKVIKVIDDIAFQTNILALNAAVEAARAGQYGKGFAVVAEEVRNLAAKSAEAAKDTSNLITSSIEKAQLGSRIAGETSQSLVDIVSGINESSVIIDEIAKASETQSDGVESINASIEQVSAVVQQNSATAEESAASAEELSSQSSMLEALISQFKLRGNSTHTATASHMLAKPAVRHHGSSSHDTGFALSSNSKY